MSMSQKTNFLPKCEKCTEFGEHNRSKLRVDFRGENYDLVINRLLRIVIAGSFTYLVVSTMFGTPRRFALVVSNMFGTPGLLGRLFRICLGLPALLGRLFRTYLGLPAL